MSKDSEFEQDELPVSRRAMLAGGAGLAALSASQLMTGCATGQSRDAGDGYADRAEKIRTAPQAPFDSFRDYIEAIEAYGLVFRVARIDQDAYELTALIYRLIDEYGWYEAPCIVAEEVKIDGKWVKGPVVVNHMGHWFTEGITFGVEPVPNDGIATYRKTMEKLSGMLVKGEYPQIEPVEVDAREAPCKEIVLRGDDIDLTKFAYIKSNPADSRRYINTGSSFTDDPVIGKNFGTYRCELRGPRLLGFNPEPNQTAWRTLMAAKERGEKSVKVSIALGLDPITWTISGSRIVNRLSKEKFDELAIAGGMRGKPVKVVRSETNEHRVPANAEMIIEGEVPLNETMPEGPFGEMYQYLGVRKEANFILKVSAVTHRKDPWVLNQFTGVTRGYATAPTAVLFNEGLRALVPNLIELHSPVDATGLTYVRIRKEKPGDGIRAGKRLAAIIPIYKVMVVVDEDIDVLNPQQVNTAIGSRYRPLEDTLIIDSARGMPLDPSLMDREKIQVSKVVIDATVPWPEEGGPENFAKLNRTWLEELAPESFELVQQKWGDVIKRKQPDFGAG
jgi:4-hydroxy-3-polyprenylbenzoate decarboxylase